MLKYCDEDGIEKTIIDNENINDYVSGSGSGVSSDWKNLIEETVTVHSRNIDNLNARQNISIGLNGSTLYINW